MRQGLIDERAVGGGGGEGEGEGSRIRQGLPLFI